MIILIRGRKIELNVELERRPWRVSAKVGNAASKIRILVFEMDLLCEFPLVV